ncbi:MAG: hypothetical protein AAGD96_06080 [Chloroflexota bacterium]
MNSTDELVVSGSIRVGLINGTATILQGLVFLFAIVEVIHSINLDNAQEMSLFLKVVFITLSFAWLIFCSWAGIHAIIRALGNPFIIVNKHGISCIKWPFTLIPWEDINNIRLTEIPNHNRHGSTSVLQIYLNEPGKYSANQVNPSPFAKIFGDQTLIGNGSNEEPIEILFINLNTSGEEAYQFANTQHALFMSNRSA